MGKGGLSRRWLNDLVRSSLIQCQWRGETVSGSGLGQLLKEVTPDPRIRVPGSSPAAALIGCARLCGGNTESSR